LNGALSTNTQLLNNGTLQFESLGEIIIEGNGSFQNNGFLKNCSSNPITVTFDIPVVNQGTINGTGTFVFNAGITNNGSLNPGCSPGHLVIYGDLALGTQLNFEIMGNTAQEMDHLKVVGNMTASGTLNVIMGNGTSLSGPIELIDATNMQGNFTSVNLPSGYALSVVNNKLILSSSALPVELVSFDVVAKKEDAYITWLTSSEVNNDHFELIRSSDGRDFYSIAMIKGKGNSMNPQAYDFIDQNPLLGTSYYQLIQYDFDGKSAKSEIKSVRIKKMSEIKIYPTVINDFFNLSFNDASIEVQVFNSAGQFVDSMVLSESKTVNTSAWLPGVYLLKINDGAATQSTKLIKF
jgi:hypothetical protein